MLPGSLVGEIDDPAGNSAQELIAYFATKEKFVGVAVEQKAKASVEPRPAKKLEIGESRIEVKRGKHGQGLVELFDAPAVIEEEQAVDESSLAAGGENIVGAEFGLEETMRCGN